MTQNELIDEVKLTSLGQLSAGVPHEKGFSDSISFILLMDRYEVESTDHAKTRLGMIDQGSRYDFIIYDIKLPEMSGPGYPH